MYVRPASVYPYPERAERQPYAPSIQGYEDGFVETAVIWRVLWNRRRWLLASCLVCVAAALVYGLIAPSQYTATTQVIVDPRDRQVVSNDVNPSAVAPDGGITQVESQVSVMQSSSVLLGAIAATGLTKDAEFNGEGLVGRLLGLSGGRGGEDGQLTDLQARTLAALRRNVTVKRADKVLVIDVSVMSRDSEKAARIANAIADAYLADQARARAEAARRASGALSGRLDDQRRRVEEAELAIERYRAENKLIVTGGRLVSDQQLNELNTQHANAQNQVASLRAQLENRVGGRDVTSEAQRSAVITKLREQESTLAENVANLATNLGPRHPSLAAAQAQLQNVRDLIGAELGRVGKASRVDYDRALANERALAAKLEQLKSQSLTNDKASVRLRELQRELEAARAVYANFLQRAQETAEQASVDTTNARVITRAFAPLQRSWPPLPLLLIGAALAGLGFGASAALAREFAKPRIMSAEQAKFAAAAPVLAVLPPQAGDAPSTRRRALAEKTKAPPPAVLDARANRAIQLLLTGLMDDDLGHGRAGRSIVVTSSSADAPQRRAFARLIATVASRNGERVILVDADIADADRASAPGLLDLLRGEETLRALAVRDKNEDFFIIGKGRAKHGTTPVSRRDIDGSVYSRLRRKVDLLVVDAGVASDNYVAAPFLVDADAVLVVAQTEATTRHDVRALTEATTVLGAQVAGVLLIDRAAGG